jgi:mannose-6-phosphate isomerase-like protein (cupin superfamily)
MTIPIEPFEPYKMVRDWGEEAVIAEGPGYCGKILTYGKGQAGGLQAHRVRDESFFLLAGSAWVDSDDGSGNLIRCRMERGQTWHIPPGAAHRFEAIEDCVVIEISTSAKPDRVRLEEAYGLPDPGGLPTTWPTED